MKQEKDDAWVNALYGVCDEFKNFLVNNAMAVYCWNAKGLPDGFEAWYTAATQPDKLVDFSNLAAISGGASDRGAAG